MAKGEGRSGGVGFRVGKGLGLRWDRGQVWVLGRVAETGIVHTFSSPAAAAEPSARNQLCLSFSVTTPPEAVASATCNHK